MDFDLREHAAGAIRVRIRKAAHLVHVARIDDEEAACSVGERAREQNPPLFVPGAHVVQVRRTQLGTQRLGPGAVAADNDEQHCSRGYPVVTHEERLWVLERFVSSIDELKAVLGADTTPVVDAAKLRLVEAMAARDRGDRSAALRSIAEAMAALATLGDRLGGAEGAMMRAVTAAFIGGLARADREQVEASLAVIRSRAGKEKKPS